MNRNTLGVPNTFWKGCFMHIMLGGLALMALGLVFGFLTYDPAAYDSYPPLLWGIISLPFGLLLGGGVFISSILSGRGRSKQRIRELLRFILELLSEGL